MVADPKKDSHLIFQGVCFDVEATDIIGRAGRPKRMEYVKHPGAVVILPVLDEKTLVMIKNYRIAVDETLWELPAGTLEPGETPLETAKRELIEETGYQAGKIEELTRFYTSPGISNEVMVAFVAHNLTFVGQNLEDDEEITTEKISFKQALELAKKGEIRDGKSLATLLHYHTFSR